MPAACTAELTIPLPAEPTAAVLFGRSVSPAWNSIAASSTPRASAATCVAMVRTPVPNSCVAVWTTALPSACTRARARCSGMKKATGYPAAAMPVPMSQSPSVVARGVGSRSDQRKVSAPRRRHSGRPSLDHALPCASTGVWLRNRSSTGSSSSSDASSSMAISRLETPSDSPGPRVNVGVMVLPRIRR